LNIREKELDVRERELDFTIRELNAIKQDSTYEIRKSQMSGKDYTFITAKVINASSNKKQNYLTLDKGAKDNVRIKMGVINESGVVGIVSSVSDHFAVVLPILNPSSRISAKIKEKEKIGSLVWDGKDPRIALLEEVPRHIPLVRGDTVVTSGYSSIFPEGIGIGTVLDFKRENDNFYFIKVELFTNFNQLSYVDVIDYRYAEEQEELERKEGVND
jgi:rod shape-determining protein MreC